MGLYTAVVQFVAEYGIHVYHIFCRTMARGPLIVTLSKVGSGQLCDKQNGLQNYVTFDQILGWAIIQQNTVYTIYSAANGPLIVTLLKWGLSVYVKYSGTPLLRPPIKWKNMVLKEG